jgi:alkylated DNA nucleotide flippase Atl1
VVEGGVGVANASVAAFGRFSDDVMERRRQRETLDLQAQQIANDVGDPRSARQFSGAMERISSDTGIDPTQVLEAMGTAQERFSALGDIAQRASYLNTVLPELARAAVASRTSLTDMVGAAGEFQRQLGITNQQMPAAISQAIASGRLGSISFADQARHMGAIGGGAARFLSNNPTNSLQSLAATNALFQTAGQAGGGGDVSATRARAFLDNFTSGRGQGRLTGLLGHGVLDASGQIRTNRGESQTDALIRTIEEAFRRSHGNADQFLTGVAGTNARSRQLGDQLFRDLRQHGGRLTAFRGLIDQSLTASPENVINPGFEAVQGTAAVQRSKQENRAFFRQTGAEYGYVSDNERAFRAFQEAHPFLASITPDAVRSGMNIGGAIDQVIGGRMPDDPHRQGDTRGESALDVMRSMARREAYAEQVRDTSMFSRMLMPARTAADLERRTQDITNGMAQRTGISQADLARPLELSDATMRRLADIFRGVQVTAQVSPTDAAHASTVATTGADAPPPGSRARSGR